MTDAEKAVIDAAEALSAERDRLSFTIFTDWITRQCPKCKRWESRSPDMPCVGIVCMACMGYAPPRVEEAGDLYKKTPIPR